MNINFDSEALKDVEDALTDAHARIETLLILLQPTDDLFKEKTQESKQKIVTALGHIQAQRAVSQHSSLEGLADFLHPK